jgi:RecB family endonuclease NucS
VGTTGAEWEYCNSFSTLATVRLVLASCTVDYDGRLTAHLPEAKRLIMVKADGCVAVHADGGAYKPLNWMNAPNRLIEDGAEWRVVSPKGETLLITMHEVFSDTQWDLGLDPGLQKDGVEAHLQELLANDPTSIAEGYKLVRREFPTDIGPVDLLCRDEDDAAVAIEVKRRGDIDGVEQLSRYLEFLNQDPRLHPVRGVFVAQEIKPQAKVLASERSIECVEIDYDELRGIESPQLRLL